MVEAIVIHLRAVLECTARFDIYPCIPLFIERLHLDLGIYIVVNIISTLLKCSVTQ